jgi:hypothetical protein
MFVGAVADNFDERIEQKIFIAFGIYQTISAFRKYGK